MPVRGGGGGAGLMAVEKQVHRGTSDFTQTYWVRADEIRGMVKTKGFAATVAEFGGVQDTVDRRIRSWGNDVYRPNAVAFRRDVCTLTGQDLDHDLARISKSMKFEPQTPDQLRESVKDWPEDLPTTKAMIGVSQAMHDQDTVTLYRGIKSGFDPFAPDGPQRVKMDYVTSFTEDPAVAERFASGGRILKVQVPRSAILLSHRAISSWKDEAEVVISTNGAVDAEVFHHAQDIPRE